MWAAIAVGGGAVGLVVGGILVEAFSWPWIFFVNVPVGIAAFILSLRFVPESKDEHVHKSFDLAGAVTVTGAELRSSTASCARRNPDGARRRCSASRHWPQSCWSPSC